MLELGELPLWVCFVMSALLITQRAFLIVIITGNFILPSTGDQSSVNKKNLWVCLYCSLTWVSNNVCMCLGTK